MCLWYVFLHCLFVSFVAYPVTLLLTFSMCKTFALKDKIASETKHQKNVYFYMCQMFPCCTDSVVTLISTVYMRKQNSIKFAAESKNNILK